MATSHRSFGVEVVMRDSCFTFRLSAAFAVFAAILFCAVGARSIYASDQARSTPRGGVSNVVVDESPSVIASALVELDDPKLVKRYHDLIDELRCPKCQNQNLADSDAPIAADLKNELSRLLREGKSNDDILSFMQTRYGNFVLYRPPLEKNTVVLWLLPLAVLLVGLFILFKYVSVRRGSGVDALSVIEANANNTQRQGDDADFSSNLVEDGLDQRAVNASSARQQIDRQVDALLAQHNPNSSNGGN